jgi:hypothetical protein
MYLKYKDAEKNIECQILFNTNNKNYAFKPKNTI